MKLDGAQILVAAFLPALFRLMGWPMPAESQAAVFAYIGYSILAFVVIRFVTAPYFIWKEQNTKISTLTESLSAPQQHEESKLRERFAENAAEAISLLSDFLIQDTYNLSPSEWQKTETKIQKLIYPMLTGDGELAGLWKSFSTNTMVHLHSNGRTASFEEDKEEFFAGMEISIRSHMYGVALVSRLSMNDLSIKEVNQSIKNEIDRSKSEIERAFSLIGEGHSPQSLPSTQLEMLQKTRRD